MSIPKEEHEPARDQKPLSGSHSPPSNCAEVAAGGTAYGFRLHSLSWARPGSIPAGALRRGGAASSAARLQPVPVRVRPSTQCAAVADGRDGRSALRITTQGVITEFPIPSPASVPAGITARSDSTPGRIQRRLCVLLAHPCNGLELFLAEYFVDRAAIFARECRQLVHQSRHRRQPVIDISARAQDQEPPRRRIRSTCVRFRGLRRAQARFATPRSRGRVLGVCVPPLLTFLSRSATSPEFSESQYCDSQGLMPRIAGADPRHTYGPARGAAQSQYRGKWAPST
jgi:hypothetical protein